MRSQFGSIPALLYTDHQNLVRLQDAPLDRIDPVAYRINAELTQDGSELRNLAGRTIRIADGLSRSTLSKELGEERQAMMRQVLEERTQEMIKLQALLKDETNDFFHIESDLVGTIAPEDYGLQTREAGADVRVLFLAPYVSQNALAEARFHLLRALEIRMPGCNIVCSDVEPPFEEPMSGEYFWLAPYARQATEVRKRFRKQVLAGIITVLRAVCRIRPAFIVGIQQGAMIAALCSNPLVVEVAARQRVATDAELAQLRATWPEVRSILAIRPFVTVAHSTLERLLEAIPEITACQRTISCSVVLGTTATERRFAEAVAEALGGRIIPPDLAGLNWKPLLEETVLLLPWPVGRMELARNIHLT